MTGRDKNGPGKNQAAPVVQDGESDLTIPKLGQPSPFAGKQSLNSPPVAQDGEGEATGPDHSAGQEAQTVVPVTPMSAGDIAEMKAQIAQLTQMMMAKHSPAVRSGANNIEESLQPPSTIDIPATGSLEEWARQNKRHDLVHDAIEPVGSMDHAEALAFNEELMIINIAESSDPAAENPVPVYNNGRSVFLLRGRDEVVRRKYVEQLLRAKPLGVQTKVVRDADGEFLNRTIKTSALKYPFAIIRDDNPLGKPWAKKILSEG